MDLILKSVGANLRPDLKKSLEHFSVPGIAFLLVAVTLAICWPVVHCDFITLDDYDYFVANKHVQTGLAPDNIVWAFTTVFSSNWHPLTWISLMLDAQLFGAGPFGPHFVNLLFHIANTVLLFFLLRQLTAATWKSALVAALFALHPLHVESVAWVAERKDVLSAFFGLISLWAYVRYAQARPAQPRSRSLVLCYLAALSFFAFSLMAKPMLVTLPGILLLLDYWPLERIKFPVVKPGLVKLILEKVPFLILSLLSSIATLIAQQRGGAVQSMAKISFGDRVENLFVSYARYLEKTFWPAHLANPYPYLTNWPGSTVAFSVALFILICVAVVVLVRRYPFGFVGWFWFVGMLIPVIGLVQVGGAAMADRYTYLPSIGIFIILVWAMGGLSMRWDGTRPVMVFLAVLVISLCAWRTRVQIGFWQNTPVLFGHAFDLVQDDFAGCNSLGLWMTAHGDPDLALYCYRRANQLNPADANVLYNLGNSLAKAGQKDEAIDCYRHALRIGPPTPDLLNNLGAALVSRKQYPEAITNFELSLKLNPDSAGVHNNLAVLLFKENRFPEAAQHFQEALRLMPDDYDPADIVVKAQLYSNLGDAFARAGNVSAAIQSYQQALQRQPDNAKLKEKLQALQSH